MITLGESLEKWPLVRILTAPRWGGATNGDLISSGATWTELPMWSKARPGYELLRFSRTCLPAIGEATFRFRYGVIDGSLVGESDSTVTATTAATEWDPNSDTAHAVDLYGREIRIQMAPAVAQGETPTWRTVWWGQVETTQDIPWPSTRYPAGERIYHCSDALFRMKRWILNRHGVAAYSELSAITTRYPDVFGHPGYNASSRGQAATIGNRSALFYANTAGDSIFYHTYQGANNSESWTDLQAAEHAMAVVRPAGEPKFTFSGTIGLLGSVSSWPVNETESAWDFLVRVVNRKRARGVAFLDWEDDSGSPLGPLVPTIKVNPQTLNNIVYISDPNNAGTASIDGANAANTTKSIDLIGDHRVVADMFRLGDRHASRYDKVTSIGERIQVLATLSYYDSGKNTATLQKRWTDGMQASYAALASSKRLDEVWRTVWQYHGLLRNWDFRVSDHNGVNVPTRCDYRTGPDGRIEVPGVVNESTGVAAFSGVTSAGTSDSSVLLTRILEDTPLYEGYDYTASVSPKTGTASGIPPRRPPFAVIRTGDGTFITGDELQKPLTIRIKPDGILSEAQGDTSESRSTRYISDRSTAGLDARYNLSALAFTVGIEMPHRVQMSSLADGVNAPDVRRELFIEHAGINLWLAHQDAIWTLDTENRTAAGSPAKRNAAGGTAVIPGILRDDRAALAYRHALSCEWFLREHRTCEWGLRACGFLPSFISYNDLVAGTSQTIAYPTIGQFITTIAAAGQTTELNTPLTYIGYDHSSCVTSYRTDWSDLDYQ